MLSLLAIVEMLPGGDKWGGKGGQETRTPPQSPRASPWETAHKDLKVWDDRLNEGGPAA